jgi:hypothetical protein
MRVPEPRRAAGFERNGTARLVGSEFQLARAMGLCCGVAPGRAGQYRVGETTATPHGFVK